MNSKFVIEKLCLLLNRTPAIQFKTSHRLCEVFVLLKMRKRGWSLCLAELLLSQKFLLFTALKVRVLICNAFVTELKFKDVSYSLSHGMLAFKHANIKYNINTLYSILY